MQLTIKNSGTGKYPFFKLMDGDNEFCTTKNIEKMDKTISKLRTYFRVSNAAFTILNAIESESKGFITPNKMQQLHKIALEEIEKENPDLSQIDKLLAEMKKLVEEK